MAIYIQRQRNAVFHQGYGGHPEAVLSERSLLLFELRDWGSEEVDASCRCIHLCFIGMMNRTSIIVGDLDCSQVPFKKRLIPLKLSLEELP